MESGGFSGKICLVTGGASGIGQATCRLLAKLGATVVVADINLKMTEETKKDLHNQSNNHTGFQVDVSVMTSVKNLADQILEHYKKPPTVIIHCAGIAMIVESTECTEETWNKIIDVNLKGTFFVNQVFLKLLKNASMKGTFVNISSIFKDGAEQMVAYAASKGGVEGLTKSLAREYGSQGFRFNTVAPGLVKTPMLKAATDEIIEGIKNLNTMKRGAMPEELATVCAFLASDASSYINGTTIEANGGKVI